MLVDGHAGIPRAEPRELMVGLDQHAGHGGPTP